MKNISKFLLQEWKLIAKSLILCTTIMITVMFLFFTTINYFKNGTEEIKTEQIKERQ